MAIEAKNVELPRAVKICGTEATDPPSRPLVAGPLRVELENGQLRYVSFAGVEVLRGIAFLVRDENWGTYTAKIDDLVVEESLEGFSVTYRAVCADSRQKLVYEARITGSSSGSLSFDAVATPQTDVVTNRTGFVVLHPAGLAGRTVSVTHVDGSKVEARFPDHISPSQPIFDIRTLAHGVLPGLWAECRMEGDAFEMEDQRNWSDASYKTYVRPLALPWAYTLAKDSRHEQAVRLSFAGRGDRPRQDKRPTPSIAIGRELKTMMPDIGVGLPAEEAAATLAVVGQFRSLSPRFLVAAIDARDGSGLKELPLYRKIAEAVHASLTMEIVIPDETDVAVALEPIAAAIGRECLKLNGVIVSSEADLKSWQPGAKRPERPSPEEISKAARAAFPGVRLGGGMLSTFTELNRRPPKTGYIDYVTHTTCSIVHAADDRSVMETLETLPAIIASTRAMIGAKPYRIGPSAIAARSNPYGKGMADNPSNIRVCLTDRDPRQRGLFNAAWTLGYIAACAYGGLEGVAMGAVTGPFGLVDGRAGCYPAFHVMAGLARGCGRPLVEVKVSHPRQAAALAWREGERTVLWLANLGAAPLALRIEGLGEAGRRLSVIDVATFEQAARTADALDALAQRFVGDELTLDAYAVARIA
jgi:D-apionolactonase